jgi:hypothetical protein
MTKARTLKATTVPGLSSIPSNITPELRRYLENLAEAVEIRLGRRGDERDRAITLRELLDSGLAVELGNNPYVIAPGPPPPPPPPPPSATPTAPTNFTANGGYSLITCFWDYPNYSYHSLTEIWRNSANVIGDAQLVGVSSGISFVDPVGEGASFYYWARHVNEFGVAGPYNAINGTFAQTALDVVELLNVLTGAITESQLYQTLQTRISLIDAGSQVAGSVNARILTETNARVAAIQAEATARSDAILAEAQARGTAITNEANTRQAGDDSLAQQITTLTSVTLPGNYATIAALQSETTARTNAISAEASARDTLATQVRGNYTGSDVNALTTGLVYSERLARVSADSALSSRSDALEATVNHPTTGLPATRSTLLNDYYTKAATDSAIASSASTLTTNFNNTLTGYVTNATLTSNYYTASQTDSAISAAVVNLVSTTTLTNTLSSYVTSATLTSGYYTKTATDSAISAAVVNLVSTTSLNSTLASYVTSATLTSDYYTKTATDSAISSASNTLTSNFNNTLTGYATTASVQQNYFAKADGQSLQGQYTVKIDLNGYVTGFGLASTAVNGTPTSEFIVRADRFSIASPGQTTIIPFIVQSSATTINGVSVPAGVYMNDAYIRNGTITNAKIGNAAIDDAKIASLSADKITAGSIDAARLTIDNVTLDSYYDGSIGRNRLYIPDLGVKTAKIDNLAVSTLKIAGAAITVPQVYTSGEILVSSAIAMTGGGPSYTYNYVGTGNGDYVYVYDPWYGIQDYFFVGAGNGDYTRTETNTTPTFTGATLAMETPQINIGIDTTAACQFVFYATMDAAHTLDCGQHLFMMMDKYDGNGYLLIGEQRVGTRTYGGDTKAILPITMTYTGTALQNVRIKVVTGTRLVDGSPGQGSNSSYLKNITLSVMGVKR